MKNAMLSLMRVMASFTLASTTSYCAIVDFVAGNESVLPGQNVSVAITVNSSLTPPSVNWGNASFNLVWNSSVLTLQATPVDLTGSALPLGLGNFGTGTAGQLNFSWLDSSGNGVAVPDTSTLFKVNFTATGPADSSTVLSFVSIANIGLTDAFGENPTFTTPGNINGEVSVVPEPVSCALALFVGVFISARIVRWSSAKRCTRQPV